MRFLVATLLAAASLVSAAPSWSELRDNSAYNYEDWKNDFGKHLVGSVVHSEEAFNHNLHAIRSHNAKSHGYKMGVNKFTGMTKKQFKQFIGRGYVKPTSSTFSSKHHKKHQHQHDAPLHSHKPVHELPANFDWRSKNVTSAVKDQSMCGGCWAFSTAETIESHVAIQTGQLFTLSEQEILACTPNKDHCGGTGGCAGATQELGFGYVSTIGLATEKAWPYQGTDSKCDWTNKKAAVGITGYIKLPTNNYTALINAAVSQPIAISAAAGAWQFYESGVLDSGCDADVDHAIQLVGWGTDSKFGDYWTVRNSWGPNWGEEGYIRIKRFGEGKEPCAVDSTPLDGDGCQGGPSSITVCGLCGILSDSSYPLGGHVISN